MEEENDDGSACLDAVLGDVTERVSAICPHDGAGSILILQN